MKAARPVSNTSKPKNITITRRVLWAKDQLLSRYTNAYPLASADINANRKVLVSASCCRLCPWKGGWEPSNDPMETLKAIRNMGSTIKANQLWRWLSRCQFKLSRMYPKNQAASKIMGRAM